MQLDLLGRLACLVLAVMLVGFVAVLGMAIFRLWLCDVTSCDKIR
jgi:hypothetical protein